LPLELPEAAMRKRPGLRNPAKDTKNKSSVRTGGSNANSHLDWGIINPPDKPAGFRIERSLPPTYMRGSVTYKKIDSYRYKPEAYKFVVPQKGVQRLLAENKPWCYESTKVSA
jgi:hypothetical protein